MYNSVVSVFKTLFMYGAILDHYIGLPILKEGKLVSSYPVPYTEPFP